MNNEKSFLWQNWFEAIMALRPACARMSTFLWLVVCAVAMSIRDKLVNMLFNLLIEHPLYLIADAYYASKKVAMPLRQQGNYLIARVRTNAVAYLEPEPTHRRGARPRKYGEKLRLREQFDPNNMLQAKSPVYGEQGLDLKYRPLLLLWRPLGFLVQFVLVEHPIRGRLIPLCTDLSLDPLTVIKLYGLRFKIEVSFRQAINSIGSYAYHYFLLYSSDNHFFKNFLADKLDPSRCPDFLLGDFKLAA